jgi:anti-sigma B factor antagonist
MSDIKISLDTSGSGAISIVRVDGVIDTMTAPELEKVMNSLLEQKKFDVIVDLGGVDYISSAGWGIFISNIREIRQNNGDIKLARMIPNVYEIFELLEFDSILRAFDSIEKAKTDFPGSAHGEVVVNIGTKKIPVQEVAAPDPEPVVKKTPEPEVKIEEPSPVKKEKIAQETPPIIEKAQKPTQTLDRIVFSLIEKDPFLTVSEISSEIRRKQPYYKAGWWKIWGILRRNGLLRRRNRFRWARANAGKGNE